jgi:hypothetical protein
MRKHKIVLLRGKKTEIIMLEEEEVLVRRVMLPLAEFIFFCLLCFQNVLRVRPFTEEESEVRGQFWMKFIIVAVCQF